MIELNKIYNEDCLEGMKSIPDGSVDMTLTSPPYDNLRTYDNTLVWNKEVWENVIKELYRVTKDGGIVVWIVGDATIKGSETGTSFKQALYFKEVGFNLHDTMIYSKPNAPLSHKRYEQEFEYMFIFSKCKIITFNGIKDKINKHYGDKISGSKRDVGSGETRKLSGQKQGKKIAQYGLRGNIWHIPNRKERYNHPAIFPEQLAHDHIKTWSNENDIILDPFMGSGTTAIACINTQRNFIGFEVNKDYYDIACKRIEEHKKEKHNASH